MEEHEGGVVFSPISSGSAEERMLRADMVAEMVARAERGEGSSGSRASSGWIARRSGAG